MMLLGNILYTVSSENTIKYSEIPIYEDSNKYNDQLKESYYVEKGIISTYGDKIISKSNEILVINKYIDTNITNKFYSYITPICDCEVGMIFGIEKNIKAYKYYYFQINENGNLSLLKNDDISYERLVMLENKYIQNYNKNNTHKMGISFNPNSGEIITSINDELIFSTSDTSLHGNRVGLISKGKFTIFKQILTYDL